MKRDYVVFLLKHKRPKSIVGVEFGIRNGKVKITNSAFYKGKVVELDMVRQCMRMAHIMLGVRQVEDANPVA